jgi:RNA polymerase sigma factor (sigma-70 family)
LDPEAILVTAASSVARQYHGYVDREDLIQEGRLWLASHPERVAELAEKGKSQWLYSALAGQMDRFAREQRAAVLGYEPSDEHFYNKGTLALILPHIYNNTQPNAEGETVSRADPAEGGNWPVIELDVRLALSRLSPYDQAWISLRWEQEHTIEQVASLAGVTVDHSRYHTERALRRLIEELGGQRPRPCPRDCEHYEHDARLRVRPGKGEGTFGEGMLVS